MVMHAQTADRHFADEADRPVGAVLTTGRARAYPPLSLGELAFLRSTKCCLCGGDRSGGDPEVVEEVLHADAEGLVVAVDGGPVCGFAAAAGAADAGDVVAIERLSRYEYRVLPLAQPGQER
jgi:hypothetical protein